MPTTPLKNPPQSSSSAAEYGGPLNSAAPRRDVATKNITILDFHATTLAHSSGHWIRTKSSNSPPIPPQKAWSPILTLTALAADSWRNDPVFKQHYRETGFVVAADSIRPRAGHASRTWKPRRSMVVGVGVGDKKADYLRGVAPRRGFLQRDYVCALGV